jgi:hypothetical protein
LNKLEAFNVCQDEGESWVEENKAMIGQELNSKHFKVMRWVEWMDIPEIQKNLDLLWDRYRTNDSVRQAIKSDTEDFLRRRGATMNLSAVEWDTLASHELEELAVYMYQTEVSQMVNLYPGSDPIALQPKSPITSLLPDVLAARQYVLFDIRPLQQQTGWVGSGSKP